MNRRGFLKATIAGAGAVAVGGASVDPLAAINRRLYEEWPLTVYGSLPSTYAATVSFSGLRETNGCHSCGVPQSWTGEWDARLEGALLELATKNPVFPWNVTVDVGTPIEDILREVDAGRHIYYSGLSHLWNEYGRTVGEVVEGKPWQVKYYQRMTDIWDADPFRRDVKDRRFV